MKKNLKKLISTIAALAIAVSCVPAFAADFTDVADTADYKAAVDNIVALGIAQGNPDGTFAPENLIKRSEAAKMIVGTMGPAMMNAAAASQGYTGFSDVPAEHWASGFVVQGVSKGYINGMGDGTFAPDANVTFGQIVKMLVCVLGYEEDAEAAGGWNGGGYLTQAGALGVTDGFANYPADQAVNRAEVAQLINNALTIPVKAIVDYTTGFEMDEDGKLKTVMVPVMKVMNGKNGYDYETLLTTYFEAYAVRGRITSTDKKVKGVVTYDVEYAKNFEGYEINRALDGWKAASIQTNFPATADVDALLGTYTNAIVMVNEDDEYELLSIESYGKNDIVELSSELFVDSFVASDDQAGTDNDVFGKIEFYKDADSSRKDDYKLDVDVQYFVNGKKATSAAIANYVKDNETTVVKLVDTPEEGRNTIDGIYDFVMLSVYTSAVVEEVLIDEDEVEIFVDKQNTSVVGIKSASIEINLDDIADGDAEYTMVDTEGNEVKFEELAKDDVITIYTDFLAVDPLKAPASIDIVVSKNTVEGAVSENDDEKKEFAIDGEFYGFAHDVASNYKGITVGESYTLFLDMFGKVVKTEGIASSVNYGIINRVFDSKSGEQMVRLVNADGEIVSYEAKDAKAYADAKKLYDDAKAVTETVQGDNPATENTVETEYTVPANIDNATLYSNVVVTYKLNASDKIYAVEAVTGITTKTDDYSEDGLKIGSVRMSDITKVVDFRGALKKDDKGNSIGWEGSLSGVVGATSTDMFVDDEEYTVLYGGKKIDNCYPLVIVLSGNPKVNDATAFAVVKSAGTSTNEADGISYPSAVVLEGNVETKIFGDKLKGVKKGDVIVYSLDSEGLVDEFYNMYSGQTDVTFEKLALDYAKADSTSTYLDRSKYTIPAIWKSDDADDDNANIGAGVIIDRSSAALTVGKVEKDGDKYVTYKYEEVDFASEVNVYVYDQEVRENQVSVSTTSALQATRIGSANIDLDQTKTIDSKSVTVDVYNWTKADKIAANTVFYKTVDDEITDILVIYPAKVNK